MAGTIINIQDASRAVIKRANYNIKGMSRVTCFVVMVPVTGGHIVLVHSLIVDHL